MTVTLQQAKEHLRVTHNDEDGLIADYMAGALAWIKRYTGDNYSEDEADLVIAELLLIGHYYNNREAVNVGSTASELPLAVEALASPFRNRTLA